MGDRQRGFAGDPEPISQFEFLDDAGMPQPISRFEFLDEDSEPEGPLHDPQHTVPLPYAPVAPGTPWEAMDADYRQPPGPPPSFTVTGLFDSHAPPEIVARRARLEFPVLVAWILLSCLALNLACWFILGGAMIAFSYIMRAPLRLCGLRGQAGIYRALGIGQILYGLASLVDPGPFAAPLAVYGISVLLSWAFVEGRQLWLFERDDVSRYSPAYYS